MSSDGRFAPSPTGALHLGNLRTALLAWLFARRAGARFLVRMEDLDQGRVIAGSADQQLRDLRELGIDWDGEVVFQSNRHHAYEAAIDRLLADGRLYECFCTRAEIRAESARTRSAGGRPPARLRRRSAAVSRRQVPGYAPSGSGP